MGSEVGGSVSVRRRIWDVHEKRRIVEQTLCSDESVAVVARQHGVNANQVFYWRKLYRAGQLGLNQDSENVKLLPVSVNDAETALKSRATTGVSINIEIPGRALVSVEGAIDAGIIRAVLESLRG